MRDASAWREMSERRRNARNYLLRKQGYKCAETCCDAGLTSSTANLYQRPGQVSCVLCRTCCDRRYRVERRATPTDRSISLAGGGM